MEHVRSGTSKDRSEQAEDRAHTWTPLLGVVGDVGVAKNESAFGTVLPLHIGGRCTVYINGRDRAWDGVRCNGQDRL